MNKQILQKLINQIAKNKEEITKLKREVTRLKSIASNGKLKTSYKYFEQPEEHELEHFLHKFKIGRESLLKTFGMILDYLRQKNKTYSDYRAFTSNWLRRNKIPELTTKEIEQNKIRLEKVNKLKLRLKK